MACLCVLAACESNEGGMGLPQQIEGERYPGERREVQGRVMLSEEGCVNVRVDATAYFVIWPAGSDLADAVRLPDGSILAVGDMVQGTGAFTPTEPLLADANGYWAHAIGYCAPDADQVLVFDEARRAGAAE